MCDITNLQAFFVSSKFKVKYSKYLPPTFKIFYCSGKAFADYTN